MSKYYIGKMKRISKKRLLELGFEVDYSKWWNGNVFVVFYPNDKEMTVYVCAQITSGEDYARPAVGVKNEKDLLELCRLVNGVS